MHIDEFIQMYTNTEQEKVERRDVMARFQNKSAVQNISAKQADFSREMSPIRSP